MAMIRTDNTLSHVSVCTPTSGLVFRRSLSAGRKTFYFVGSAENRSKHRILRMTVNVCVRSISESAPLLARMKSRRSENCSNTGPFKANGRMSIRMSRAGGERVSARRQSARGGPKWRRVTLRGQAPRLKHT